MNKKVFISYSWDNEQHNEWVLSLANKLRENGIEAVCDIILTENELNKMMVDNVKNSDKIIIVLTENYTEKAEFYKGGVGFETKLLYNVVKDNSEKIIVLLKEKCALPFYIKSFKYIDFNNNYKKAFEELLYRIEDKPLYDIKSVASEAKKLVPKKITDFFELEDDDKIANLKTYSEKDINNYVLEQFDIAINNFIELLEKTKKKNSNFEYKHTTKTVNKNQNSFIFVNDKMVSKEKSVKVHYFETKRDSYKTFYFKLWCDNILGENNLSIAINKHNSFFYETDNLNSYSNVISAKVENHKISLSDMNSNNIKNGKDLALYLYQNMIERIGG